MDKAFIDLQKERYLPLYDAAGIVLTAEEKRHIEICDYELGRFEEIGTGIVIYVNTERCCAKEMALLPWQLCPEHRHPPISQNNPGKEETFRCRMGEVYLYVPGEATEAPKGRVPEDRKEHFTVWHEILLRPGEQYTLYPNTKHWFQAGPEGAVISEFSTSSADKLDIFTDPGIIRTSSLDLED